MLEARSFAAPLLALLVVACGGANAASAIANPPEYAPKGQTKCAVKTSQAEPLIVEWPPAERGRLESSIRGGLAAVRYEGCEMKLLPFCKVHDTSYSYTPLTRKEDAVHITNEDELYARLPAGALSLEGKLKSAGSLDVEMTLVGRYESGRAEVAETELDGECEGATHVVTALTVGAFKFFAGGNGEVGGSVGAFGAGASGDSTAKRETLTQDGDEAACAKATSKDTSPPDDCGALLRIEVVPIKRAASAVVPPAPTTTATTNEPPAPAPSETPSTSASSPPPPPPSQPETTQPDTTPPSSTASSSSSSSTTSATGDKGPLGIVVGWTALGALTGWAVFGTLALATASSYVGDQSTNGHCLKEYSYCDADGISAKNRAHTEALISDVLLGVGSALTVTWLLLPNRAQAPQVGIAATPGGAALRVGGTFE